MSDNLNGMFYRKQGYALQIKGRRESNINGWFQFTHSQKLNCTAWLYLKLNYYVLSPNFHTHVSAAK
jgi:hypothetical protein